MTGKRLGAFVAIGPVGTTSASRAAPLDRTKCLANLGENFLYVFKAAASGRCAGLSGARRLRACPVTVSGLYGGTGEAAGHDDDH